jgi:hypothetical protein
MTGSIYRTTIAVFSKETKESKEDEGGFTWPNLLASASLLGKAGQRGAAGADRPCVQRVLAAAGDVR